MPPILLDESRNNQLSRPSVYQSDKYDTTVLYLWKNMVDSIEF